jgi:hypothetical protein
MSFQAAAPRPECKVLVARTLHWCPWTSGEFLIAKQTSMAHHRRSSHPQRLISQTRQAPSTIAQALFFEKCKNSSKIKIVVI